jgi:hypothetical protein
LTFSAAQTCTATSRNPFADLGNERNMAAQLSQCNQGQPVDGEQSMAKKAKEESPTRLLQAKIARKDSLIRSGKGKRRVAMTRTLSGVPSSATVLDLLVWQEEERDKLEAMMCEMHGKDS